MGMKLAVMADIHGNMPALEAVLADLEPYHVDGIIVAGDMVMGPNSAEVLQRLQNLDASMIRGNNEEYMLQLDDGTAPIWWQTARQFAPMCWEFQRMDRKNLDFIKTLPEQLVITRPGKDAIRVVHGSLDNNSEHLYPEYGRRALERDLAQINEPVLVCGHSHIPWQVMQDGCLVFNPGAVSAPLNGVTGAQYAVLEWKGDGWELEFHLVDYDLSLARQAFVKTGYLEAGGAFTKVLLKEIETGRRLAFAFLDHAQKLAAEAGSKESEYIPDEIWDRAEQTFDWNS